MNRRSPMVTVGGRRRLVLNAALTGARYHPSTPHPRELGLHIPIGVKQTISDAISAYREGARFFHIHARNPLTGTQFSDRVWYQNVRDKLHQYCPDALVGFPTSRKGEVAHQIATQVGSVGDATRGVHDIADLVEAELIRAAGVFASPNTITCFTASEIRMFADANLDAASAVKEWIRPDVLRGFYRRLRNLCVDNSVYEEVEITTMSAFDVYQRTIADSSLGAHGPIHIVVLLGFSNGLPIQHGTFKQALDEIDKIRHQLGCHITVSIGAVIRPHEAAPSLRMPGQPIPAGLHDYREVIEWCIADERVDCIRIGLEDTPMIGGEQRTNAWLVQHATAICLEHGVLIETNSEQVLAIFGFDRVEQTVGVF